MENLKRILCPIDLTPSAYNVMKYALSFAGKLGVETHFVHISTRPPEVYYRFFPDVTGYLRSLEENVQADVQNFQKEFDESIEISVRYGTVYQEVLQYAQDEQIDLIMLAAGGFTGESSALLSTEVQKIIRKSVSPVLTVHGKRTTATIKRILCPVDLSERSYRALDEAAVMARIFGAEIFLLHVVELHEFKKRRVKDFRSDDAFEKMSQLLKSELQIPDTMSDISIERVVRRNVDAAAEISYFADQNNIDLIMLTTHGHGYLPRVLLGSVTEKVAQISPCPVMTIRVKK